MLTVRIVAFLTLVCLEMLIDRHCQSLTVITATGEVVTKAALGSPTDVDVAVKAARAAFKTTWGLNCPGSKRGELLNKLADLVTKNMDEIAAIEALNTGMHDF
jgi:aldehyde dehydrogenase (NAD+)